VFFPTRGALCASLSHSQLSNHNHLHHTHSSVERPAFQHQISVNVPLFRRRAIIRKLRFEKAKHSDRGQRHSLAPSPRSTYNDVSADAARYLHYPVLRQTVLVRVPILDYLMLATVYTACSTKIAICDDAKLDSTSDTTLTHAYVAPVTTMSHKPCRRYNH